MRSLLILFVVVIGISAKDILDEEAGKDVQRYCERYAACRKSARQQFEKCAGGFSKMIVAQTDSLRIKPSSRSEKCEQQLLENIKAEIEPVYQSIEHDTFECTKTADPQAFNLDQSQTIICKAIQQEVGLDNFAIAGAEGSKECRNTFESQMQRCDLVRECCPQFSHCHTKAEIQNNVYGKEEKLAQQLDECIGYKKGGFKVGLSGEYKHEDTRKAEPSTTTEATTASSTSAAAPTVPTIPPADKVLNDLAKLLFPAWVTHPPTTATTTAEPSTAATKKWEYLSISQKALLRAQEKLAEQKKQKEDATSTTSTTPAPPTTTTTTEEATTAQKATTTAAAKAVPKKTEDLPEIDFSSDDFSINQLAKWKLEQKIIENNKAKGLPLPDFASPQKQAAREAKVVIPNLDRIQKESLTKVHCETFLECQAIVEKQFEICDEKYQPEDDLFGIEKYSLRQEFLKNSNVSDIRAKRRCLEAVDPESQKQLRSLERIIWEQNEQCTRKAPIPPIPSEKYANCQNVHLLTVVSELFMEKDIPEGKTPENAEKCYGRLQQLQSHCETIRQCCPQNAACANINRSSESLKYHEIIGQLKEEQNLCEKRRMRIINGLVRRK